MSKVVFPMRLNAIGSLFSVIPLLSFLGLIITPSGKVGPIGLKGIFTFHLDMSIASKFFAFDALFFNFPSQLSPWFLLLVELTLLSGNFQLLNVLFSDLFSIFMTHPKFLVRRVIESVWFSNLSSLSRVLSLSLDSDRLCITYFFI